MGRFNVKKRDIESSMELNGQLLRRTSDLQTVYNEYGEKITYIKRA